MKTLLNENTPEFQKVYKEWQEYITHIETIEEFDDFFNSLMNNYYFDYGTQCRAIGLLAVAAAWLGANTGLITGFQASFVMWEFIQNWTYRNNKTGLKIMDYDNMLYPQYEYKFDKTISPETWNALQNEASRKLRESSEFAHSDVVKHWKSIVDGKVPFGYKVKNEEN